MGRNNEAQKSISRLSKLYSTQTPHYLCYAPIIKFFSFALTNLDKYFYIKTHFFVNIKSKLFYIKVCLCCISIYLKVYLFKSGHNKYIFLSGWVTFLYDSYVDIYNFLTPRKYSNYDQFGKPAIKWIRLFISSPKCKTISLQIAL